LFTDSQLLFTNIAEAKPIMSRTIRINTPEYIFEINVGGHIIRGRVDEGGPHFLVDEEQEAALRAAITPAVDKHEEGDVDESQSRKPTGDLDKRTHTMNVAEAGALVQSINSTDELIALQLGEKNHPDFPGGRKGVLNLIDSRFGDIERGE
jgi:hypothetical protein